MNHNLLIFLTSLIFTFPVFAQTRGITFSRFSEPDGLSNSAVHAITQDENGFIWIGTEEGLSRFDGYTFKNYFHDPKNPNSISDNMITSLCADSGGILWIGTYTGGLTRFNTKTEEYSRFLSRNDKKNSLSSNQIYNIYIDKKHNIWVGTDTGLNRIIFKPDSLGQDQVQVSIFKHDKHNDKSIAGNIITDIIRDNNGEMWIGTTNGLSKSIYVNDSNLKFISYRHNKQNIYSLNSNAISCLEIDPQGTIWIGTSGNGINRFDPGTGIFKHFTCTPEDNATLSGNNIKKILCDQIDQNILWIGTLVNGFNSFNIKTFECLRYMNEDLNTPESAITAIFQDGGGNIWFGCWALGISKFNIHKQKFLSFTSQLGRKGGLSVPFITGITEVADQKGKYLWLASAGAGLYKYNFKNDKYTQFLYKPQSKESSFYNVFRCMKINESVNSNYKNLIWIGTSGDGLAWFDIQSEKYLDTPSSNDPLLKDIKCTVTNVFFYFRRSIELAFIGTKDRGVYIYDFNRKTLKNLHFDADDLNSIQHNDITNFFSDDSGNVWICTNGGGISIYNPLSERIKHLLHNPMDKKSLPHNSITIVYQDREKKIWIGTIGAGLCKYDRKEKKFTVYSDKDGLPSNCLYGIIEDSYGYLWLSTFNGLARFDPGTENIQVFDYSDGIPGRLFLNNGYYRSLDGSLIFGGMSGFTIVSDRGIKKNTYIAPIVFTNFTVNNKPLSSFEHKFIIQDISYTNSIVLPYTHNTFAFEFAYLDFYSPIRNKYRFKLDGFDHEWVTVDASKRYANYTQVSPGTYTFYVKGSNNDGVWNPDPAYIHLTILPPWYRTNLAYMTYVLLGLIWLISAWRFQVNRLKMKHQTQMDHFKLEKLQEVDEAKSRFFANISHEFRTPLTLIEGPIKQMLNGEFQGNVKEAYNLVLKNTRRLLNLINQLLDLSKLEAKRLKLQAARQNIIQLLNGLVQSFESLARQREIEFIYIKPEEEIDLYIDTDKFEKIINNLLFNALKFTPDEGRITVSVSLQNADTTDKIYNMDFLHININNTASFLSPEQIEHIFDRFYQADESSLGHIEGSGIGLALVKELVELHYGQITVQSDYAKGTTFIVKLPMGKEHLNADEIISAADVIETYIPEIEAVGEISEEKSKFTVFKTTGRQRILIVEDNQDVRSYVAGLINAEYSILEAETGVEALQMARRKNPDLIITDVMMPGMDGMEFCRLLKEDLEISHIPVIILTARADFDDKIAGLNLGADDYIAKPFEAKELRLRIRNVLKQRERLRNRFSQELSIKVRDLTVTSVDGQFLQKLIKIIEVEMHRPEFNIEEMAKKMDVSRATLKRKIKALTDISASTFLRRLRMNRARALLRSSFGNISEVSFEVGYNSLSHFTQAYIKQFGTRPSDDLKATST